MPTNQEAAVGASLDGHGFMKDEWQHTGANDGHATADPDAGFVARVADRQIRGRSGSMTSASPNPPGAASSPREKSPGSSARDRVLEAAAKASRRNAERMANMAAIGTDAPEGVAPVNAIRDASPKYTGQTEEEAQQGKSPAPKKEPKWF